VELGVRSPDGKVSTHALELPPGESEMISVSPDSIPLGWQDTRIFFREQYFPGKNLYYIQYNKCWSRETEEEFGSGARALFMPSFREFEKRVLKTIRKKKVDKLVFDMRFNGGGNAYQGTMFIEKLCGTGFKGAGRIYVVVGRGTTSSALINTVDFIRRGNVVIVGENTGGRPNHYGEIDRFVLPESHLVVSYSKRHFTLLPDDLPSLQPDLSAPMSFKHYMQGIDPAIRAILEDEAGDGSISP
jgi:hypothetical protein